MIDADLICDLTSHIVANPNSLIKLPNGTSSIELKLPLVNVLQSNMRRLMKIRTIS